MKSFILSLAFFFSFGVLSTASAEEAVPPTPVSTIDMTVGINPIITGKSEIQVGKRLYLDAGDSSVPQNVPLKYTWSLSGEKRQEGRETFYTFETPGEYTIELEISAGTSTKKIEKKVFAYKEAISFLYNGPNNTYENNIQSIRELAKNNGIFLNVIESEKDTPLIGEDVIYKSLSNKIEEVKDSRIILAGPYATDIIPALSKLGLSKKDSTTSPAEKDSHILILTTNDQLWLFKSVIARLARLIQIDELLVVRQDPFSVLNFLLQSTSTSHFKQKLPEQDFALITSADINSYQWAFLSQGLNRAIESGIPASVLSFILIIPLLLTVIAFFKQFIGIETLGLLQTLILMLSFYILGIKYATFILLFIITIGILIRPLMSRISLFYIPKVTLTLSFATLALLGLLIVGSYFNVSFGIDTSSSQRALLSLVPMLLIAFQTDKLSYRIFKKQTGKKELLMLLTTYLEVVLIFAVARIDMLRLFLFALPELVVIAFLLQYLISKYTGLRFIEVFRFRELLIQDLEE